MPSENNFNPYKFSLFSSFYISIGTYFVINYNDLTISLKSVFSFIYNFCFKFSYYSVKSEKVIF